VLRFHHFTAGTDGTGIESRVGAVVGSYPYPCPRLPAV
jgi:hypothetical protein